MSTDLRAKIAAIVNDIISGLDPRWASASIVADDVNERTDEVLAVVAEWLRAEAAEVRSACATYEMTQHPRIRAIQNGVATALEDRADSLTTQPSTEEPHDA